MLVNALSVLKLFRCFMLILAQSTFIVRVLLRYFLNYFLISIQDISGTFHPRYSPCSCQSFSFLSKFYVYEIVFNVVFYSYFV